MKIHEWYLHKFIIVDLVPEQEMQTARFIEDSILDSINIENADITCDRVKCSSDFELLGLLESVRVGLHESGKIPYIHIEGHGSKDSLYFPDNTSISWGKVFSEFRKMNILSRNRLFVSSGACESAYAFREASILAPTPVFGLLAPENTVQAGSVVDGFSEFFKSFIQGQSLNDALESFADNTDSSNYALILSQNVFEEAAYKYITEQCMGKGRRKRLETSVSQAVEKSGHSVKDVRRHLKKLFSKPQAMVLKGYHDKFMMCDIYPENKRSFPFDAVKFEKSARNRKRKNA